ncbi:MAG: EAL domain-containing protein [Methylophilaceae bacterium]|jgi:diguanylate cyclase (GGDEF)-like protein/PAS domain S-box-containing protein|nr:EAL domain-containing protein [Methylophilaceae bacterium]
MQSANILIVEDESIVALDLSGQLQEMGYRICGIADNGKDAIALVEQHHPTLVLMDIIIKGEMDGIETARHISHRYQTPIIFLTAYSDPHTVERAAHTAPYGYLTKPFQANELRAAIEVALYKAGLEKRLRESERWFATTLSCVADGVIATNKEGLVQFLNPTAEATLGWSLADAKGRPVEDIMNLRNARTGVREESPISRALQTDGVVGLEFGTILASRNGQQHPIDDSAAPIRGVDGSVMGAVMAFRDVSERLAVEKSLRRSEEHFRKAFDFAPVGMALIGLDGAFLQMNSALCKLLGYDQAELAAIYQTDLTHPADRKIEQGRLAELLSGNVSTVQFEKRYLPKNGTDLWTLVSVSLLSQGEAPMCYLYQIHDLTESKNSEYQLSRMAHFDTLTGLANRSRLLDEANDHILVAKRQNTRLAIVFLDLDHFKEVNDSLGHEAGDLLLQEVGSRLKTAVRETDCVSRFGGDEFVLLLPNIQTPEDVSSVVNKILIDFKRPVMLEGQSVVIGTSMGVSLYPEDGQDAKTLLRCADSALYQAKAEGRNNVQFYRAELTARIEQRFKLEKELRHGIEHGEFELYYQPIIALNDNKDICAEALIRWHHPQHGLLQPDAFIPFAEETGLIVPIGDWVIATACAEAARWQQAGKPISVSINISARQFKTGNLVEKLTAALAESGLSPSLLCLEITEQFLLHDTEHNMDLIAELKAMGLKIAIDDFGIGYSSLSYFKRFGPAQIKIDRSFISGVIDDAEDAAIVRAIIAMAKSLNVQLVAEGVETVEQLAFISKEGCDKAQGFLYASPVPAADFRRTWVEAAPT